MDEVTVSISVEQHERLEALAEARGVSVERQLARLVDDAYAGLDASPPEGDELPLGVCEDDRE